MAHIDRRRAIGTLVMLPAGLAAANGETTSRLGDLFIEPDDRELLRALAAAVLPGELGAARTLEWADRFERWVANFRPGAELNHGYGTGTLQHAGADPWPAWRTQLHALEADAQRQHTTSFTALSEEVRRALVRAQLEAANAQRLPNPVSATHVVLALLAWFYDSPEATDLCYRAAIGKETCRPLNETSSVPRSL